MGIELCTLVCLMGGTLNKIENENDKFFMKIHKYCTALT